MKLIQNILLYFLLFAPTYTLAQVFSFEKLHRGKIDFTQLHIDEDFYSDKLSPFADAFLPGKSKLLKIKIWPDPAFYHWCNDSLQQSDASNCIEYLEAFGGKINIDALFIHNANHLKISRMEYVLFNGDQYSFTFGGRDFMIITAQQRRLFRNRMWYYMILLELDHGKVKNSFAFINTPENTINCFGDFNNDGNLDYMDWREKEPKIRMFSLLGDQFIEDKKHFIIVQPTGAEIHYMENYDEVPPRFNRIDMKASKWWYPLL